MFMDVLAAFVLPGPFDFATHVKHTVDLLGHVEATLSNDRIALRLCATKLRLLATVRERDIYVVATCKSMTQGGYDVSKFFTMFTQIKIDSTRQPESVKPAPTHTLLVPKARPGSYAAHTRLPRIAVAGDASDTVCVFTHNAVAALDQPVAFFVGKVPHFAEYAAMRTWWQGHGQFSPGPGMRDAPLTHADLFVPTFTSA